MSRSREDVEAELREDILRYTKNYERWYRERFGVESELNDHSIDPCIYATVVVLRQLRFNTTMSCEGHLDNSGKYGKSYLYPFARIGPHRTGNTQYDASFLDWQISNLQSLLREFYTDARFFSLELFRLGVYRRRSAISDDSKECFVQVMTRYFWLWDYVNRIPWPWLKAKILLRHRAEMERFTKFLQTKL